ncbi:MAG: alpha/beta hydrolase [Anaerolineaceae bacterium]|nr:alpha/beta hydrolase [Anaerolineaceae bacterium]MCB9097986.1 alpha/beta hydrolase [Anaerolineales bacterium]
MLAWMAGIAATSYISLTFLLYLFQTRLIFLPTTAMMATPASIGLPYEEVHFTAADGVKLAGWFAPAAEAEFTILFFHGNAGNISHRLDTVNLYHRLGFNVFIIDYRGYGQSEGRPSEAGSYLDAEAAWQHLVEDRQMRPEQIIIVGRSLGGGIASWLAQHHRAGALVLESTFTSIPDMAARQYPFLPVRPLARVRYNTLARVSTLTMPILIVHSPHDEVIPYDHGRQLFEAAPEPKQFLKTAGGHNDGFLISQEIYAMELKGFIEKYAGRGE